MRPRLAPAAALAVVALAVPLLTSTPLKADTAKSPWWVPQLRANELAPVAAEAQTTKTAPQPTPKPAAPAATPAPTPAPTAAAAAAPAAPAPAAPAILPNATLQKYNNQLRDGALGRDPNARAYIDLIAAGKASPAQVNDFAAYVAKKGAPRMALAYQEYAIQLDGSDAILWLNLGTMQQTLGKYGAAEDAYKRSIAIDPNDGLTHYNLGAAYDAQKKYDDAIEEYRKALVLDPDLGDPKKNPQVVNNDHLLAVKLEIYQQRAGALGLPLKQIQPSPNPAKDSEAKSDPKR